MKRDRYKTVTGKESFAILIQASSGQATGEATFLSESMTGTASSVPVRPVTLKDVKETAAKLRGINGKQFDALLALRGALEARDELAIADARKRMESARESRERELKQLFKSQENDEAQQWAALIESLGPDPKAKKNLYRLFSFEVSRTVGNLNAQIVLWWADKIGKFIPAIFCANIQAALYLHTFFIAPNSGPGFRICPYDGEQFFQDRSNQEYCCPAHREAHRVARWREQAKGIKTATRGKTGRKNVTQKTR